MSWREKLPRRMTELSEQIRPDHTVLLMVDMQNDFVHDDGVFVAQWGKSNQWIKPIVPRCRELLDAARSTSVTVVHLRIVNDLLRNPTSWHNFWGPPSCVIEGSWGAEFVEQLKPTDDEFVITKYTYDGFLNTALDAIFRRLNVRTFVLAGVDSDVCVRDTAAHGFAIGYTPVLAGDATASDNEIAHAGTVQSFSEHYGKVVSTDEIVAVWRAGSEP